MAWRKIPPQEIKEPEMDSDDYLTMAMQIGLPIAGAVAGGLVGGPSGIAVGAGAGQALAQFGTAAIQDDPREAQRYIGKGLQAGFLTLPHGVKAYQDYQKNLVPSGATSISDAPMQIPQGSMSLAGAPANPYQMALGGEELPSYKPDPGLASSFGGAPVSGLPDYWGSTGVQGLSPQTQDLLWQKEKADIYGQYG